MSTIIVRVALPRPVEDPFHYEVPPHLAGKVTRGSIVHVPFGKRTMTGVVVDLVESSPVPTRSIVALSEGPSLSRELVDLAQWTASYYQSPGGLLLRLALPPSGVSGKGPKFVLTESGRQALEKGQSLHREILETLKRGPRTTTMLTERFDSAQLEAGVSEGLVAPALSPAPTNTIPSSSYRREEIPVGKLTLPQEEALSRISDGVSGERFEVILLKGVTGSGKTEVYLRAALHTIGLGKRVLLLVPEISLTPLLVSRLEGVAAGEVATLHSGMSDAERTNSWEAVRRGQAKLVVGVRSGVFAPIPNLGLIIVDEEHDTSFRQEDTPSYNARDVAVKRGQLEKVPVVLGSATPSFESWYNASEGKYHLALLPHRVTPAADPDLLLIDMSDPAQTDFDYPALSVALRDELTGVIERGEQAMLFLNRRGLAPFLLCPDCRHTVPCPNCSVTLTYHANRKAVCHYCGHKQDPPDQCPDCGSRKLGPVGTGTQGVEKGLKELFPGVAVDRLDRDALGKKGALEGIYRRMDSGETTILVGTQMLAKGHDFPNVTLAGILSAEQALDLPDFRSGERTFQIITQVAGRAGRGERPGKVVIQTFTPDHYAITTALSGDHEAFYSAEIETRRILGYPPFGRMGRIILDGANEEKVTSAAFTLTGQLPTRKDNRILGPAPAPLVKIRNRYRWHILVLTKNHRELVKILHAARKVDVPGVRVTTRVDPVQLL
ncbi:primosomal protein N' [bacterium]|nr:primosomal protein N' [bacterium]